MSDLVPFQTRTPVEARTEAMPMRLVEWAEEAKAAHALAQSLCQTPFAGQYKNDALGATAAILKGAEVGLTPVTALGAFDLIQGTPAPKAITLRALVQAHGHAVWIDHSTDSECVAKAQRRGESVTHESRWTIKRAQGLGLTNKQNWKQQPAAMLMARATAEVCRMVAADVILGIGYSAEEVADEHPAPTATVSRSEPAGPRKVSRKKAEPAPDPEPELEPEPLADEPVDAEPTAEPKRSDAQSKMLFALLNKAGLTDRDEVLGWASTVIGRELDSTRNLTVSEASACIDALNTASTESGD